MPQLMQRHKQSSTRRSEPQRLLYCDCRSIDCVFPFRWVWVPDEKSGYLPGWIVKEEKADPAQALKSIKGKTDAAGDYLPSTSSRHGKEVSLEDASLVGDTVADVVLANGGDVSRIDLLMRRSYIVTE